MWASAVSLARGTSTASLTATSFPHVINTAEHHEPQTFIMAPVPLQRQIKYESVALVAGHALASLFLTFEVGRSLYRSYRGLGPAQDTRDRRAQRSTLIPIFSGLALLSLAAATYGLQQYGKLSYKVWAGERDVQVPERFFGDRGMLPFGENATDVHLGLWLSDTTVHLDAIEILTEKARRFWWAQQLESGMISWNLLLAIEGRRRNIPLLWCYSLLGQLVSLSYAQNLFFVALLLTPSPLPPGGDNLPVSRYVRIRNAIFPPKPNNWMPHPLCWVLILSASFTSTALAPFFANTDSLKYLVLANRSLSITPLLLQYLVPAGWGITHTHPHQAYGTYTKLFKFASVASFMLHARATIVGMAFNAPDTYYHRHSIHLPFDVEKRAAWERTTTAFGRVLGATSDHPLVASAGLDVLLSTISLGLWAAVRAVDAQAILTSSIPWFKGTTKTEEAEAKPKQPKALTSGAEVSSPAARRRGRPRKTKVPSGADSDHEYEPTVSELASALEGDVVPHDGELDWESTALVWGLTALGGLGTGTAGILGGETIAR